MAVDCSLGSSAPGDSGELSSAARDVPNALDGVGGANTYARTNDAASIGYGDGPVRAHQSEFCERRVARSDVEVLHNVGSPAYSVYSSHDVQGSSALEHKGAYAAVTGLRDHLSMVRDDYDRPVILC